jgi:addiction module HigA family antidote
MEMKKLPTRPPTPPGEVLAEEFLNAVGITQVDFAGYIGVDVKTINRLVNGRTRLTPKLAHRIAAALNTSPDFWMNLQQAVDLFEAKQAASSLPEPLPQFMDAECL